MTRFSLYVTIFFCLLSSVVAHEFDNNSLVTIPDASDAGSFFYAVGKTLILRGEDAEIEKLGLADTIKGKDDASRIRRVPIQKFASVGLKKDQTISSIDFRSGKVINYKLKDEVTILFFSENGNSYHRYAVLMSDDKKDHEEALKEDMTRRDLGVAYIGDGRTLVPALARQVPLEDARSDHPILKSKMYPCKVLKRTLIREHEIFICVEKNEESVLYTPSIKISKFKYYLIRPTRSILTSDNKNMWVGDWIKDAIVIQSDNTNFDGECPIFYILEAGKVGKFSPDCVVNPHGL